MTWEELKEQQAHERKLQLKLCQDRRRELYLKQKQTIAHCHFTGPNGQAILGELLDKQRHLWYQNECDEWSALLDAHQKERASYKIEDSRMEDLIQQQRKEHFEINSKLREREL